MSVCDNKFEYPLKWAGNCVLFLVIACVTYFMFLSSHNKDPIWWHVLWIFVGVIVLTLINAIIWGLFESAKNGLRNRGGTDQDFDCGGKQQNSFMCKLGCDWIEENGFDSNKECGCRTCPTCVWVKHDASGRLLPREQRKCMSRDKYDSMDKYAEMGTDESGRTLGGADPAYSEDDEKEANRQAQLELKAVAERRKEQDLGFLAGFMARLGLN